MGILFLALDALDLAGLEAQGYAENYRSEVDKTT